MNGLRWFLGTVAAVFILGFFALVTIAGSFRRSFGASDTAAWMTVTPIAIALLCLASVSWPDRRTLLHVTAVGVALLLVGCVLLVRDAPFVATLGAAYSCSWLLFYHRAVWKTLVPSVLP